MKPLAIDNVLERLPGRRVSYLLRVDSTMHEAARLAAGGVPAGTTVIAEEQTAGMGRQGHSWHSEPGCGLYCSVVLRPKLETAQMPLLTLALGLAAREAIARVTGLTCDIRWPNDLMLEGRKVAGLLVQALDQTAVAGIGINVNHASFPPELAREAISLRIAGGREYPREDLLVELLGAVDEFTGVLAGDGPRAILDLFEAASTWARGRRVRVDAPDGPIVGTTAGLDASGFLRVRRDDGAETLILAGGVRALSS